MPTATLCNELLKQYMCQQKPLSARPPPPANRLPAQSGQNGPLCATGDLDDEYLIAKKRRVVKFVRLWLLITREQFFQQQQIQPFLTVSPFRRLYGGRHLSLRRLVVVVAACDAPPSGRR